MQNDEVPADIIALATQYSMTLRLPLDRSDAVRRWLAFERVERVWRPEGLYREMS
jgi:hypothetical protein